MELYERVQKIVEDTVGNYEKMNNEHTEYWINDSIEITLKEYIDKQLNEEIGYAILDFRKKQPKAITGLITNEEDIEEFKKSLESILR